MPSFKKILINNQLIKGRLRCSSEEIRKLYLSKVQQNQKIQKQLINKQKNIEVSLDQIRKLKFELRYCEESLQKAFHPSAENIALLYKNVGSKCYIKARFYWRGKQREVQVGSIPIVLDIIQKMIEKGFMQAISIPKSDQIPWEQFKKRKHLIDATKEIAALKFQEYILRKLFSQKTEQYGEGNFEKINNKKLTKKRPIEKYTVESKDAGEYSWYVKWRENNL